MFSLRIWYQIERTLRMLEVDLPHLARFRRYVALVYSPRYLCLGFILNSSRSWAFCNKVILFDIIYNRYSFLYLLPAQYNLWSGIHFSHLIQLIRICSRNDSLRHRCTCSDSPALAAQIGESRVQIQLLTTHQQDHTYTDWQRVQRRPLFGPVAAPYKR